MTAPITVSFGKGATDHNITAVRQTTLADLARIAIDHRPSGKLHAQLFTGEKADSEWIAPAKFNGYVDAKHFEYATAAVLDSDDGTLTEVGIKRALSSFEHLAYSSYSTTEEKRKWRIMVPLSAPVSNPDHYRAVVDSLIARFPKKHAFDKKSRSPFGLWYWRSINPDAKPLYDAFHVDGGSLDVANIPVPEAAERTDSKSKGVEIPDAPAAVLRQGVELIESLQHGEGFAAACKLRDYGFSTQQIIDTQVASGKWDDKSAKDNAEHARDYAKGEPNSRAVCTEDDFAAIEKPKPKRLRDIDPPVSLHDLDTNPPPNLDWVVEGWLARGVVHTFFARGATGKSLVMQQLLTSVANGRTWLGMECKKGRTLGVFCEEGTDELRRRQRRIFFADMLDSAPHSDGLDLWARLGKENVLASFSDKRTMTKTNFFAAIEAEIEATRPLVVVLDNIAQLYAGPENERSPVTQFVNLLSGLADRYKCAIILVGHTAKSDDSEFSGSTAWENAVRMRWFLKRDDDGASTLAVRKANLAAESSIRLFYDFGAFKRHEEGAVLPSHDKARDEILTALSTFTNEKQITSASIQAGNYLPKLMSDRRLTTQPKPVLAKVLGDMIREGVLYPKQDLPWTTKNRHQAVGIVVAQ